MCTNMIPRVQICFDASVFSSEAIRTKKVSCNLTGWFGVSYTWRPQHENLTECALLFVANRW